MLRSPHVASSSVCVLSGVQLCVGVVDVKTAVGSLPPMLLILCSHCTGRTVMTILELF